LAGGLVFVARAPQGGHLAVSGQQPIA
jgi:hypothetical protein